MMASLVPSTASRLRSDGFRDMLSKLVVTKEVPINTNIPAAHRQAKVLMYGVSAFFDPLLLASPSYIYIYIFLLL